MLRCDTDRTMIPDDSIIILPVSEPRIQEFLLFSLLAAVMQGQHPKVLDFFGVSFFFFLQMIQNVDFLLNKYVIGHHQKEAPDQRL